MAQPKFVFISATPGVLGGTFGANLFTAVETSARAVTAGYEGKIFCVMTDDTVQVFDPGTKTFSAAAWPF